MERTTSISQAAVCLAESLRIQIRILLGREITRYPIATYLCSLIIRILCTSTTRSCLYNREVLLNLRRILNVVRCRSVRLGRLMRYVLWILDDLQTSFVSILKINSPTCPLFRELIALRIAKPTDFESYFLHGNSLRSQEPRRPFACQFDSANRVL